jgi:hypothetical protein
MPKSSEHRCESCQQTKPADRFLPSSLSTTGYTTKCLDCIKLAAARHQSATATPHQQNAVPTSRELVKVAPKEAPTLGDRLPERLYDALKRYVLDYQAGREPQGIEPEFRAILEWVTWQALKNPTRSAEEIGRELFGYKDPSTSRGVAYGAAWGALVRAAAVYGKADTKVIDASPARKALPATKRKSSG